MLNLSDKELDRLAREAANEYDPGNQAGPGAWDRLQLRMDKELGNFRPNFFRTIRRMPFYYAPAILLLVGATYYLARPSRGHSRAIPVAAAAPDATAKTENSGSPPAASTGAVRPLQATSDKSINNQNDTYKSTSTPYKETSNGTNDKALNPAFAPGTWNCNGKCNPKHDRDPATRTLSGTATSNRAATTPNSLTAVDRAGAIRRDNLPCQINSPHPAQPLPGPRARLCLRQCRKYPPRRA